MFSQIFRNYLSFGLISSHWEKKKNIDGKENYTQIYIRIYLHGKSLQKINKDYKLLHSNTEVGNPYGLTYKKNIIFLFDTPRHDYYIRLLI